MKRILFAAALSFLTTHLLALSVGDKAPQFKAKNHADVERSLADQAGKKWTVLYFYPKAETPGCTAQACSFRDAIKVIEKQNADVWAMSTDSVEKLAAFRKAHNLVFDLLSDPDGKIAESYEAKMPALAIAKRHTFIIDPDLVVRAIDREVDPAMDAKKVAAKLVELQAAKKS